MTTPPKIIRIGILVFPDCVASSAVVPFDVFNIANVVVQYRPAAEHVRFVVRWVSQQGEPVTLKDGLSFPTQPINADDYDVLIVPGVEHENSHDVAGVLERLGAERAALRDFARGEGLIASNCSGTFLLAEAGLLDGRRATTSWWLSKYFGKRYPKVALDADELIVRDGAFLSSGGATSYIDLGLWLVGHFGGEALRQMTAKILVADSHRASQTPYIASAIVQGDGHAVVERARRWLNQRMDQEWNMVELAAHCNTSARTLLRRFRKAVGLSPVQYTQQLRVERAKALLESTTLSLEAITARCGYANVSTFSTVFKRWAQVTPREYRGRFGLRA
ncbi:MAG: helix-turn-helix domain-containing protein [Telluria sp.]|nr:helix-turn-helix domain-containing protein [Telluria sp.]